jgi:putative addiction module killer protein
MFEIRQTDVFQKWRLGIKDSRVRATIASRLDRLAFGLMGDVRPVGSGISEMRIHIGPGFRIYFKQQGPTIIVLLCGGNKSTQSNDIKKAISLADKEGL